MIAELQSPRARCARAGHERALVHLTLAFAVLAGAVSPRLAATAFARPDDGEGDRIQAAIPLPAPRPGFPRSTGGTTISVPPTMADLDLDGRNEIIVVDDLGRLHAYTAGGEPFGGFTKAIGGVPCGPVAVGDIDNDGYIEIVTLTKTGRVRVFSSEGAFEAQPRDALPSPPVGGVLLTELDRSGRLAIVVATANGQLHAFDATGVPYPGWPVTGSANAVSGPFAYVGFDNFPRVGYLGDNPARAQVFFTYAQPDTQASFTPDFAFGPAAPVAGARSTFGLPDAEFLYVLGRQGALRRLDPDVVNGGTSVTMLASLPDDSVLVSPALMDATGDLVPELALLAMRGDTLGVYLLDGATGNPLAGFPRRYLGAQPVGGIVCADVGDNNAPELIFNHSGDKVSCVRSNGTSAWI
ncbi:MAG: FG-GAP-like repeat-containing protein, partial [Candidatus Eisenbacteria bacterium]